MHDATDEGKGTMNERDDHDLRHDANDEPRWLGLAADLRAEPAPGTLARVRARLAARDREPAWVRWLGRPAALATSVALLVVCAWAGNAWIVASAHARPEGATLVSALLDEDGSFGLGLGADESAATPGADSGAVSR
jgi:hypothetical protein